MSLEVLHEMKYLIIREIGGVKSLLEEGNL
jgi:hypothetical protein